VIFALLLGGLIMKKAIISVMLVTVLISAVLCGGCSTTAPGNVVTEERDFTNFTKVDVSGTFNVEITQSDTFSIVVTADTSFFDYVEVAKSGDTLKITLNPRHTFTDFTLRARTLEAKITMPALHGLRLSGASKGTIIGFKSSHDFTLDVSGASSLNANDIQVGNAELEISGASKVNGKIEAGNIDLKISGASQIELEGAASNVLLNASGASKVNLKDCPLENANVNLGGASEATVNLKGRLDAHLSEASRLYFQGNPIMGDFTVTGASTIKHR